MYYSFWTIGKLPILQYQILEKRVTFTASVTLRTWKNKSPDLWPVFLDHPKKLFHLQYPSTSMTRKTSLLAPEQSCTPRSSHSRDYSCWDNKLQTSKKIISFVLYIFWDCFKIKRLIYSAFFQYTKTNLEIFCPTEG